MGGKGSGRPGGPDRERLQIVYKINRKRHCFTVYLPPEEYDLIEAYCEAKELRMATYTKRLIAAYFRKYQKITIDDPMPYTIWYGFRNFGGKEISAYLWKIIQRELICDEDYQKFIEKLKNDRF